MAPSRVVELSNHIEQNTRKLDDSFSASKLPSPSFDASTPPDLPLPPDITEAKEAAPEAMDELQALPLGPMDKIFHKPIHTEWTGSEKSNQTAWNLAHHTKEGFLASPGGDEAKAKRFADSMSFVQASPGMQTSLVINNYDWSKYKTVVDVGGSHGVIALELVKRFPTIMVTVQGLPEVIATAPAVVDCDFFTEQLVKGADIYFFRMIFHNWGDDYCIQILRKLILAL
ncbi:S-adenosyl-L-methionine-dependent methyltransferase [Byssothecium circinans]|uniref:S-adenosyl-L-methionine-dependent methyltransferase n=1 Tax=Byssothecium circinans TaxID=147558 RepID=A0A6A5U4A6_9PLEO|nr:S-adenosyl-L-methionine-dependent methyltransferase [Byssothecium circinans]